ncbi:hypothetical protein COT87_02180 [Candidatus Collierbacteria bacterium CG10_big_fil_rev_8_21_14_0_10_44_9]|uniref:Polymerase nucleotidyl transferase domain-containing protein n=1 Tax=Candidatus Collierbacteria bacterium CG10_big_fil_rev_8_21_14_0_10_44_9 TaxID=1974535 RepID=A0A2H0VII2_9BACT|nr:MAG: hypothetical protein COT87_02180 [Candidatus Collierbacteria bacterium CG10_big_fil_rev_8_21_14_0_10_44_9]
MTLLQENSNSVSFRAQSRDLSVSILQTLKYSDHFDFPLTKEEIYLRLIGAQSTHIQLTHTLNQMIKKSQIKKTGIYYHLSGRKSLIAHRLVRTKLSIGTLARAKLLTSHLSLFPFILAIYLTGSLAMSNSEGDSDIDLMIVTKDHRLWTTRFILTIYTEFMGLRRHPHAKRSAGKLCLNLYLTPASYTLPIHKQSLYTAYELIQAVPLYDPHNTHAQLLAANPWIHSYLPNAPSGPGPVGHNNLPTGPGPIGLTIERICYHLQLLYMRKKITRELITPDAAFFHPHDPGVKALRGLSLKGLPARSLAKEGIPGCKPSRARQQAKGESSIEPDV